MDEQERNEIIETLKKETNKWLARLESETKSGLKPHGKADPEKVRNSIVNIEAYIKDCKHFMEKEDMVRAFEAIVYAWGIYETLLRLELIKKG